MYHQERFIDTNGKEKFLQLRFNRESRLVYRAPSLEDLVAEEFKMLIEFIDHHRNVQAPRIRELYDYAEGNNHDVLEGARRRMEEDASDARAVHNFGGMVATFKQGYIAGNPIQINYTEQAVHDMLQEVIKDNDTYELDRTLIKDLSSVGRAYDITYRNQKDQTKVRRLDPMETFVIYDMSLSQHSICAVRYYQASPFKDDQEIVELYTDDAVVRYELKNGELKELSRDDNFFFEVQITEYKNNILGMGDFETELTLIDLYDGAQSDTANYMKDLSDAILFISGLIDFPDDFTEEKKLKFMQTMKRARMILGQPPKDDEGKQSGTVDAKYIYKQYDVAGTEAYKTRLSTDIHKFTNMPDLTDAQFAGQQSGEAMKYKLFGLDQERMTTESLYRKGMTRRLELIANIESLASGTPAFDPKQLTITFTPNKTLSELDVINTARLMYGMASDLTVLETLSKATGIDAEDELERIDAQLGEEPIFRRDPESEGVADGEEANEETADS